MKTLGSHGRLWSSGVSIIFERSSWLPALRAALRRIRGWETNKESAARGQAREAGVMEMRRRKQSPNLCLRVSVLFVKKETGPACKWIDCQQTYCSEIEGRREQGTYNAPYTLLSTQDMAVKL